MIINQKYYLAPLANKNFKELFNWCVSSGVGMPVGEDGYPIGPWTAELLTDAISNINENASGIEIRTVQFWFQDNYKGAGPTNIRWLAKIFGCDDPNLVRDWHLELRKSNQTLNKNKLLPPSPSVEFAKYKKSEAEHTSRSQASEENNYVEIQSAPRTRKNLFNMSRASLTLINGENSLNLPVLVWAGAVTLGMLAYSVGVHDITYSPVPGINKQVGFIWSPNWTIEGLVLLPIFLLLASELLTFWKQKGRVLFVTADKKMCERLWAGKVSSYAFTFWLIFLASFAIIGALQWYSTYYLSFRDGLLRDSMVDWMLVAILIPNTVPALEAYHLSIYAFIYSSMIYWFYFIGLFSLFIVASDFREIYSISKIKSDETQLISVCEIADMLMRGIFRCCIVGILIAMCIKLNTVYLLSNSENILSWLLNDTLSALGLRDIEQGYLSNKPLPFFTSFLLFFITSFVFIACSIQIYYMLGVYSKSFSLSYFKSHIQSVKLSIIKMVVVVLTLSLSFLLIGQFIGFSILLCSSLLIAGYSVFYKI